MKKKNGFIPGLLAGIIIGAALFGSAAYASGVLKTTVDLKINGETVTLPGMLYEDRTYVMLVDLGKEIDYVGWWTREAGINFDSQAYYEQTGQYIQQGVTPPEPAMTVEEMKAEIVRLTNIERVKAGVPELEVLPELMDCAQAKADDMMENGYYSHTSPIYGTFGEMIKAYVPRAKSAAENLAPWTKTPAEAFAGWVESQSHYENMIAGKYTHIGIGIIEGVDGGYWWVQQFCAL